MKLHLDWSDYENAGLGDAYADIPKEGGNFAKAVAVCINSRRCETKERGVMCPSYRVSDDPELATGGRVRLLKAALNGQLGEQPFDDPQLVRAMELCVSCKGCRRECENEVDMARIKIEYLAQRNEEHPLSRRDRLFAELPQRLHRDRWLVPLIRLRNRLPLLAPLGEALLGIAARRRLPEPATAPFSGTALDSPADGHPVVLFVDSFTRHFNPAHAEAAIRVLGAGGYSVTVAQPDATDGEPRRPLCCGRTLLSQGLVEEARAEARRVVAALAPHAAAGTPIVGLEPSCLLTLRDEHLALGLGEPARQVAERAQLFEEFIAREQTAKRLRLPLKKRPDDAPPLLVHGHCHEKAVGAMKSMRKALKLIPGLRFELIEASCCGGAGSFGVEAEHADLADAMAEQALLPKLRENPDAEILANGFSCRHQMREGAGRPALHLAEVLAQALG
ncbi:(Fe-S)-binding protein [Endothiovibrio diazotrophicus]